MATRSGPRAESAKSQTIERAALILTCFTAEEPHHTLAALATKLTLNQSTAYRYVATLQAAGLLERDPRRGGYRLGPRVIELSYIALNHLEVRKHALDEMDRLRDTLDLMVSLAILVEGDVLHIAHAVPADWPRWYTAVGRRAVAHCTALGKMLLAHRPWGEVEEIVTHYGWRPYTARSIQDFDRLATELATIRAQGYSIDNGERREGTLCVAAPICDPAGTVVAALSITSKTDTLEVIRESRLPHVREVAERISFRLGHLGSMGYY